MSFARKILSFVRNVKTNNNNNLPLYSCGHRIPKGSAHKSNTRQDDETTDFQNTLYLYSFKPNSSK